MRTSGDRTEAMQPLVSQWRPAETPRVLGVRRDPHRRPPDRRATTGPSSTAATSTTVRSGPSRRRDSVHGHVLRCDTHADFRDPAAWEAFRRRKHGRPDDGQLLWGLLRRAPRDLHPARGPPRLPQPRPALRGGPPLRRPRLVERPRRRPAGLGPGGGHRRPLRLLPAGVRERAGPALRRERAQRPGAAPGHARRVPRSGQLPGLRYLAPVAAGGLLRRRRLRRPLHLPRPPHPRRRRPPRHSGPLRRPRRLGGPRRPPPRASG